MKNLYKFISKMEKFQNRIKKVEKYLESDKSVVKNAEKRIQRLDILYRELEDIGRSVIASINIRKNYYAIKVIVTEIEICLNQLNNVKTILKGVKDVNHKKGI